MRDFRKAVTQKVDGLRDYLISTTQELVRIPSVNHPPTGDEYACQMAVIEQLRSIGLEASAYFLDEVPGLRDHPSYFPGRDYSNRPNVTATRKGVGEGRSLVLSGHIDTVPLGLKEWQHDPYGAEIVDGKLFGLGAFDMKAGIAINLGVLRTLQELHIPLKGDLIFESVVDEEFGGVNGTIAGRLHGEYGDAYVISEPTALVICNGGRGGQVAHITLEGPEGIIFGGTEPGHAVRNLVHFLKWVDIFRQRRRNNLPGWQPGPLDPIPVWVTKISAGGWGWNVPITIPADVKVELYMQLMPGETKDQVRGDLFDLLDEMVADKPNDFSGRPEVEFPIRFMPGSEIPVYSPLIQSLNHCALEVFDSLLEVRPLPAPSDLYTIHLDFHSPAVHFGVRGGGAHAADEFIVLEDLVSVTKTLALLALDWCGIDG
jgi:acetylornithine deacetylase